MFERKTKTLAEKLKELRKDYCMTQDDIADLLGMSRTSFSKYENGVANPPLNVLRKIAALYNVPIEYLIHDEMSSTLVFHSDTDRNKTDEDMILQNFVQLTPEERKLILRLRVMEKDKKDEFLRSVDAEDID